MDVSRPTLFVAALIAGFLVGLVTTSSYSQATHQTVSQSASGDWVCDHTVADLWEILPWRVRYGMHYYHTYKAAGGVTMYVSGSGIGAWNSPTVAYMIDDHLGCPWTAAHVHELVVPVALTYYAENRAYACCDANGNKQNNVEWNKTHTVQFQQGH